MSPRPAARVVGTVLLGAVAAACGAKTGLGADDPPLADAGQTAPADAGLPPVPDGVCVEAPYDGGPVRVSFTVPAVLRSVDVFFLLDATGSMVDEIDNVRSGLRRRVVPGLRGLIEDVQLGVGLVGEFPYEPHGRRGVLPYALRSPITDSVVDVESALEGLPTWGNADEPEAQVEALYQVATGEGFEDLVPPSSGCPRGGDGGACFRTSALPIVLLVTDAPFHDGPPGVDPEAPYRFRPEPHDYADALAALRAIGALVVGLAATDFGVDSPRPHLDAIARDTGAIDARGRPLTRFIGASGDEVDDGVVDLIARLATDLPLDVGATLEDVGGDRIDIRTVARDLRVVELDPPDAAAEVRGADVVDARAGTRIVYGLEVDPAGLGAPPTTTLRIPGRLVVRALGRADLARIPLLIVIPGPDAGTCD